MLPEFRDRIDATVKCHRLNVAVLMGGPSEEREVSLRSGAAVAAALRSLGHTVTEIDPQDGVLRLPSDIDVVFVALHGTYGEDGSVQVQLEQLGVAYTGCGPATSRTAFDKVATKRRCVASGIATPRFAVIDPGTAEMPSGWMPPVVLKPVRQGSSLGLCFVDETSDWTSAIKKVFRHDTNALLEERIMGREATVGILGDRVLPIVEIRPKRGVYDYINKYTKGRTDYLCPAPLDEPKSQAIQAAAMNAFQAVGGGDLARVDFMVDAAGNAFVLEVNTVPGMTETSLLPKAALAAGLGYEALCQRLIELAMTRCALPVSAVR